MEPEQLAKAIGAYLRARYVEDAAPYDAAYCNDDDLTHVVLDGAVDMIDLAQFVLDEITAEAEENIDRFR